MDRVRVEWSRLAVGVYRAVVNGQTVDVLLLGHEWKVRLNGVLADGRYEDRDDAQAAAVRRAYLV